MILNHQNLPANHQILQVALQVAEQQLLFGYGENNCSSLAVVSFKRKVKAEAMNFLSDADNSLSRLHFFRAVQRLFL